MIIEERPYIDNKGVEHPNLVKRYSDLGVNLLQVGTHKIFQVAVDLVTADVKYIELIEEMGELSEDLREPEEVVEYNVIEED